MKTFPYRDVLVVLGLSLFLSTGPSARAEITVITSDSYQNVTISPSAGRVIYTSALQTSAYSQAGANSEYVSTSASSLDVPAPGASATGSGTSSLSPLTGSSSATGFIPGMVDGFDTSAGRASASGVFEITGVSVPVSVTLSAMITGSLDLSADAYGVFGQGETVFSLSLNGTPDLFSDTLLSVGPDQTNDQPVSTTLSNTMTLAPNTPYYLWIEADSEAEVINSSVAQVPDSVEGPTMAACFGLSALLLFGMRKRFAARPLLLAGAMAVFAGTSQAMYIGSDPPDICPVCGSQPTRQPAGNVSTSLSEGNLREDYPVVTITSAYGPSLPFDLTYNSYNADGSKAQLDTGLGFGWTHNYNPLLFQQRGLMFRLGDDGRVTQYFMNYSGSGGTYASDSGYFETLTQQPDGTYYLTNKNQSWWHFGSVPNSPFLVAGPVFRLLQMGDRNQNVTTMTYDANGNMVSVADTYGRTLQFTYDANHHISTVTDPLGRTTQFQYDAQGRMPTQITDPLGNTIQYTYNAQYQMTRKVDRDGRMYFYMYKNQRPFSVTDGSGQPWFSQTNPMDWAVNSTNLAYTLRRSYVPSTTTTTDGNGNAWQYTYDTNGYIAQSTAPNGAITRYTYDAVSREVSSMTDPNGNITRYQYDAEGNRIQTTDALGNVTTYTYDPVFNNLTSLTDPNGRTTTYQYDTKGNRILETDPLGHTRSWTYDAHGNVLSFTDQNTNTTTYAYDGFGNRSSLTDPLGNITTYTYDAVGNTLSTVDPLGHTTRYQYDALDRRIGMTNALNGVTSYTYDALGRQLSTTDPNTNTTTYQYDVRGRVIQTIDPLGGTMRYGYDANDNRIASTNQLGHPTLFVYDSQNRVISSTNAIGGVTRYTYDGEGNRLSATDPNTNTTYSTYDGLNRLIRTTNALGGVTTYDYAMPGGPPCCSPTIGTPLITQIQDADGNITYYHYDELNRRIQDIRKNSDTNDVVNPTDAVTTYTYDAVGNIFLVTDPNTNTTTNVYDADNRKITVIDPAGDVTIYRYDADGNVIALTAPNENTITNYYDALDRVINKIDEVGEIRSYTYDADGNVLSITDGLGHPTTYSYDALNRQVQVTDALGQPSAMAYDPDSNLTSTTDRNGHTTTYVYDALDRRITTTDALGNTSTTAYDADSNVIGLTDANGRATTYTYDGLNRRVTETYPDAAPNTRTNAYDAVGNVIERIDQMGHVTTYSYNELYYLTNRAYQPSGSDDRFIYDNGGRMLSGDRNGWVDTFTYDGADRVITSGQNGRTLTYTYDIQDRVRTNTQPSGRALVYVYDARDRLAALEDETTNAPITRYVYDAADRTVTRTYRNGTTATYTYDANDWVTSLNHSNGPSLIAGFNYAYDNDGNKLYEQKLDLPTNSAAYTYDAINRLTNYNVGALSGVVIPSPAIAKSWLLDPVGNWNEIISNGVPDFRTYGPANELLTDNSVNYTYDADGNVVQDGSYNYSYDEENRLIQIQRLSDSAIVGQYSYDALDRRVARITDPAGIASTNLYYYDAARIIEEQDPGGSTLATYTYGTYIDEILTMDSGGQTYYYHQDSIWSPHAVTDATGATVERYTYDAYGEVTILDPTYHPVAPNSWGTPHSAIQNRWIFTGRELDEESGLYFYRARYYDALAGRFLQRDPMEPIDPDYTIGNGLDLYLYVLDAPTRYVDPLGLERETTVERPISVVASPSDDKSLEGERKDLKANAKNYKHVEFKLGDADELVKNVNNALPADERTRNENVGLKATKGRTPTGEPESYTIKKACVGTLEISAHANQDEIGKLKAEAGEKLKNIKWCKKCEIYLAGCLTGLGDLAQKIADSTKCTVYGAVGFLNGTHAQGNEETSKVYDYPVFDGFAGIPLPGGLGPLWWANTKMERWAPDNAKDAKGKDVWKQFRPK